jgi:hypothetical protein
MLLQRAEEKAIVVHFKVGYCPKNISMGRIIPEIYFSLYRHSGPGFKPKDSRIGRMNSDYYAATLRIELTLQLSYHVVYSLSYNEFDIYEQRARQHVNIVVVSTVITVCFRNTLTRFCKETFSYRSGTALFAKIET